jgi:glycosyltransferase involved in cell wall biosynthesis
MAQGVPVVTSKGTSTEEVAGDAAQLVDPFDIESIANGVAMALANRETLANLGRNRAKAMSWEATALATAQVYDEVIAHS